MILYPPLRVVDRTRWRTCSLTSLLMFSCKVGVGAAPGWASVNCCTASVDYTLLDIIDINQNLFVKSNYSNLVSEWKDTLALGCGAGSNIDILTETAGSGCVITISPSVCHNIANTVNLEIVHLNIVWNKWPNILPGWHTKELENQHMYISSILLLQFHFKCKILILLCF